MENQTSGSTSNSSTLKVLVIILAFFFWLPGLIICAVCKKDMTQDDYATSRLVVIVIGFICFIIPGLIALLCLPSKK
jgi:UPF0716 family protein affecting phage T7 exclusion